MAINPMTGEILIRTERVETFCLSDKELAFVKSCLPARDSDAENTDCVTDLFAMANLAVIINASALSADDLDELEEFYKELCYTVPECVIWLGCPKPSERLLRMSKYYDTFTSLQDNLKFLLLSARKNVKGIHDFSSRIALSVRILKLVEQNPGITSKELATRLEISPRSVQRYIETLRMAGEWLEYDTSLRGWKLPENSSIMLDHI